MKSLEARSYIATEADIKTLTKEMVAGVAAQQEGRTNYLRSVVAVVQHELNSKPRARHKPMKIGKAIVEEHLKVVEAVNERFYAIVKETAKAMDAACEDPIIFNQRTNFARSAKSVLVNWVRRGHDVRGLAAAKVSKNHLVKEREKAERRAAERDPIAACQRATEQFMEVALGLADRDRNKARAEVQDAIVKLSAFLIDKLGMKPTEDMEQSLRLGRPFRSGEGTFMPLGAETTLQ